jgi:multidrug efflux pump subunit AcrB
MRCFIEAVIVVVLVALFLMDWRSALAVATAIPLTVAMTFGGMALLGIPLHQVSIAALIIALGMLVDDPVVASDASIGRWRTDNRAESRRGSAHTGCGTRFFSARSSAVFAGGTAPRFFITVSPKENASYLSRPGARRDEA